MSSYIEYINLLNSRVRTHTHRLFEMNVIIVNLVLLSFYFIELIRTTNVRCYDDQNHAIQLTEHCRACVIYIESKNNVSNVAPKQIHVEHNDFSIRNLFLNDEEEQHRRRFRRWSSDIVIHQKCAREYDGPIYGFDQTHCYCNSNLCNSNIQRCIYEIASKRYFSCYHGTNRTLNSLEILKKCRSCRIQKDANSNFHYECLTFGEQEQRSETHCTCQHPMCNQDFVICQRFQQISSQGRVQVFLNTTEPPTTTTTTTAMKIDSTQLTASTLVITNQTAREFSIENSTSINMTTQNETKSNITNLIDAKNQANIFVINFVLIFSIIISLNKCQ